MRSALADAIDALLPQTQCRKCGFDGCAPYAEAIATGSAVINRCPPGGQHGVDQLATLLGADSMPLDLARGTAGVSELALIDESLCIGCTLCVQACPVDAIVGAAGRMHTVMLEDCSGCGLCVAPCPVDCIAMVPISALAPAHDVTPRPEAALPALAAHWRSRHETRRRRLSDERLAREVRLAERAAGARLPDAGQAAAAQRRSAVAAALARARERRAANAGRHD